MAKRGASEQITREKPTDEDIEEVTPSATHASASVMAKRKILKPKGRSGAFGGNFSFKSGGQEGPGHFKNGASVEHQKSDSEPANIEEEFADDVNEKIRALNETFIEKLTKSNVPGTIADFRNACKKYIEYYDSITTTKNGASLATGSLAFTGGQAPVSSSESKSEGDSYKDDSKYESIKTTFTPKTTANSTFENNSTKLSKPDSAFGSRPEKDATTLDEKASSNDFKSTFGKTGQFSSTFPLQGQKPAERSQEDKSSVLNSNSNFGVVDTKSEANKVSPDETSKSDDTSKATFAIAGNATAKPSNLTFNFGAALKDKADIKSPFSFSLATLEEKDKKPLFSFGTAQKGDSKPAFSFNTSQQSNGSNLTFGSSESKPKEAPAFNFGSGESKAPEASVFKFGGNSNAEKSDSKPTFSFSGNQQSKTENKPLFSFNPTKSTDSKPSFSFGASSEKENPKPAFQFGAQNSTTRENPTSTFSFGSKASSVENNTSNEGTKDKDSVDEKSSETPTDISTRLQTETPTEVASAPSNNKNQFTFGKSDDNTNKSIFSQATTKPVFNFSASSASNEKPESSLPQENNLNNDNVEEDTGGDFKPITQLSDKVESHTGEEQEGVLFEKRTKLMLLDPSNKENPYISKGVGDLKVLKNKENEKVRILVRAEGSQRVLLNTRLNKEMTYLTMGNGSLVKVPTINASTKGVEVYVLKVKNADDGNQLLKVLNDSK